MRSSENKKNRTVFSVLFFYFKPPFFSFGWKRAHETIRFESTIFCNLNADSLEKIRLKIMLFRRIGLIDSGVELEA